MISTECHFLVEFLRTHSVENLYFLTIEYFRKRAGTIKVLDKQWSLMEAGVISQGL